LFINKLLEHLGYEDYPTDNKIKYYFRKFQSVLIQDHSSYSSFNIIKFILRKSYNQTKKFYNILRVSVYIVVIFVVAINYRKLII